MLGLHSGVSAQWLLPQITISRSCSAFRSPFTSIFLTNMKVHGIMPLRIGAKLCPPEPAPDGLLKSLKPPRRSANYHPSIWKHNLIESTTNPYADECFKERLEELKLEARSLIQSCKEPSDCLQLIDSMERLGVAYHFEKEIKEALEKVLAYDFECFDDLYETALCFRLLRQHGHPVSSDVFSKFRDEKGFKDCLVQDVSGLLSLYEASHLAVDGEELAEAQEFSVRHLKSLERHLDANLAEQIRHALEIPLHWRMPRLEARNFIDVYQDEGKSPILLEFAKLDFNIVQSIHQKEVKELSRWWTHLRLAELKFSRDRLLENYLWAAGIAPEPQFSKCRMGLTKLVCILTVIDDIYDVYGSFEEVESFTQAIKSWDLKAIGGLPDYQKLCYMALYNFVKETAHDIFEDHGWDITSFSQREWERLCGAYLVEAEWFHKGYKTSLKEYLSNAWISVGGPIAMVHAYLLSGHAPANGTDFLGQSSQLIYWSSLITRFSDDLGTGKPEMERGDTLKSVQCYMNETGESEEVSVERIRNFVSHSWKEVNKEYLRTQLPRNFVNMLLNMARTSQCIFEHGDGIGTSTDVTKKRISALFFEHIPLK